jgi:hypothetical protein
MIRDIPRVKKAADPGSATLRERQAKVDIQYSKFSRKVFINLGVLSVGFAFMN